MPIKINWTNGKYLGMMLFFFGIMGLIQAALFIPLGQYVINVGSLYVVILLPIGITIAMTYATQILYETYLQVQSKTSRKYRSSEKTGFLKLEPEMLKAIIIIIVCFGALFGITYGITVSGMEAINTFVVSQNVAGIGCLVVASIIENQMSIERKD